MATIIRLVHIKAFPNGNLGDAASLEYHSGSHPVCSAIALYICSPDLGRSQPLEVSQDMNFETKMCHANAAQNSDMYNSKYIVLQF